MKLSFGHVGIVLAVLAASPGAALTQETDSARIARLERQMDAVSRELEQMRLGQDIVRADSSVLGLGPAASRVYRVESGVSVGGYGEVLYENFGSENEVGSPVATPDRFDALRAILYVGYKFDDRLLFNSEIEVEHADEIFLEFAYLDYRVGENWGIRAGLLLAPLGLVNELHEPATYLGTERSVTESRIIPSTWRENGIGVFGGSDAIAWRVYVMNSLDAAGFTDQGFRGGRQKGSNALAEDLGVAARLDYVGTPGLTVGGSAYVGETGQSRQVAGQDVAGTIQIWDAHVDYRYRGFDLRALVAGAEVNDAAEINQLNGLVGPDGLGESMLGWYVQAGYDVLRGTASTHQLIPYARHERVNTQRSVPTGFGVDPSNDLSVTSIGLAWKPVPQVVTKVDLQLHSNEADTGVNQFNVQLGWLF